MPNIPTFEWSPIALWFWGQVVHWIACIPCATVVMHNWESHWWRCCFHGWPFVEEVRGGGVSSVWGCGLSRNFLYIIHTRCRLDVVSNYSSSLLLLYLFYLTNYLLLERKVLSHCGTWNKRAVMRLKMSVVWFQAFLLSVWEVISCKSPGLVKSA